MGNESSAVMSGGVVSKNTLQTQGEEHLWTVCLTQGGGGSEGACTFTRRPGTGDVADLCGAAVDVSEKEGEKSRNNNNGFMIILYSSIIIFKGLNISGFS